MAKLSAHGAEMARATLERAIADGPDATTSWERAERTFMADGKILEKRTVRFKPKFSADPPSGRLHTWGWKLRGKAKPGVTPERWAEGYRAKGWHVEIHVHSLPVPLWADAAAA